MAQLVLLPNGSGQPWLTAYWLVLIKMKGLKDRFYAIQLSQPRLTPGFLFG